MSKYVKRHQLRLTIHLPPRDGELNRDMSKTGLFTNARSAVSVWRTHFRWRGCLLDVSQVTEDVSFVHLERNVLAGCSSSITARPSWTAVTSSPKRATRLTLWSQSAWSNTARRFRVPWKPWKTSTRPRVFVSENHHSRLKHLIV